MSLLTKLFCDILSGSNLGVENSLKAKFLNFKLYPYLLKYFTKSKNVFLNFLRGVSNPQILLKVQTVKNRFLDIFAKYILTITKKCSFGKGYWPNFIFSYLNFIDHINTGIRLRSRLRH